MEVKIEIAEVVDSTKEITTDSILEAIDSLAAGTLTAEDTRETLFAGLKSADAEVQRSALGLAEEAGKASPSLIPELLVSLIALLSDGTAAVIKRALASATLLFRPALNTLLSVESDEATADSAATWQRLRELWQAAASALQTAATDAVRTAAVKFCEMLVLAFSQPPADEETAPGDWSLAALAAAGMHPLLSVPELEAQGEQTLMLLVSTMLQPPSNTTLLILITTCTSLAKQRAQLVSSLATGLAELQRRLLARSPALAALQQAQLANAQQALRSALITMLKLEALRSTRLARAEAELADALRALGATEQLKQIYKQLGTEPPAEGSVGRAQWKEPGSDRSVGGGGSIGSGSGLGGGGGGGGGGGSDGGGGSTDGEAGPASKRARTEQARGGPSLPPVGHPELEAILSRLGPHLVAELVIAAMNELPQRPAARPPSRSEAGGVEGGAGGGDEGDGGGEGGDALAPLAPGELRLPLYTPPQCTALAESRLYELLSVGSESSLAAQGHAGARAQLIGRLAAQQPEGAAFHQVVMGHIRQKCKERLGIVLGWLYEEMAADPATGGGRGGGGSGSAATTNLPLATAPGDGTDERRGRYERVLRTVLPAVRDALPANDRAYTQLLLDLPLLPEPLLAECLEADLAAPQRRKLGLATARDMALRRDGVSGAALDFVLRLSGQDVTAEVGVPGAVKSDGEAGAPLGVPGAAADGGAGEGAEDTAAASSEEIRDDAIKVLATSLSAAPHLSARILDYASASMEKAFADEGSGGGGGGGGGEGVGEGGGGHDGSEEDAAAVAACGARMQLHLALCAQRPELLWTWLRAYARATQLAQRAMRALIAKGVPHMPPDDLAAILIEALGGGGGGGGGGGPPPPPADQATEQLDGMAPLLVAILETVAAAAAASGTPPPHRLVDGVAVLSHDRLRTGRFVLPLVPFLSGVQCESLLPLLLALPGNGQERALVAIMHADPPPIPPPRLMLLLHLLPTGSNSSFGLELKHLKPAVETCMAERSVFTMQTMASCLKLIAQQEPLPLISMRTTIQALSYWPELTPFTMDLLRHLIGRRIWEAPRLFTGFVKCCSVALPDSLPVLLSLPAKPLTDALEQEPDLKLPLTSYAAMHLSEVPEEAKAALGITDDDAEEL